ncbi:pentapeptide repeat-containing protein [Glycomyces buryatensis]|uniref:Pentapeptide repeat-containing protein n=1 Tax=Glycomyces buryatensis TaxID=2570927 RepID=A0A4S8Q153_9ACTN|nr:pentapeptide repeat-containing protein [Glycomyces buryatensis]THV37758.1 pentapeptide repeat-containing protein [Glycomyces buryatensis]
MVLLGLWTLFTSELTTPLAATPTDALVLEIIRLIFYAIAGIGGVVALTIAYRKQRLGEAAEAREESKLFAEQFAAAADQLSSEQAANRLGGVYAMASLADDWDHGRQKCVNVLCAYLRMPYDPPHLPENATAEQALDYKHARQERQVRHAIFDAIGERLRTEPVEGRTWHHCNFDFSGATIDGGDLHKAVFAGPVSFRKAQFPEGLLFARGAKFLDGILFGGVVINGGAISLFEAEFSDLAQFADMEVTAGSLNFSGAIFRGFTTFRYTRFAGGEVGFGMQFDIDGSRFEGEVHFEEAAFTGTDVSFRGSTIVGGTLDFTSVDDWSHPPQFDDLQGRTPPGILLPAAVDAAALPSQPGGGDEQA